MEIQYREEVFPSDVATVRALTSATGFFSQEEISVAVELVEERLAKGLRSGYHFFFAEHGGKVLGYTCFGPIPCTLSSFDIYWIAVLPAMQSKGVGRELLKRTEQKIKDLGGTRIYVETSARAQYQPTLRFYQRQGYSQEALLKDFYGPGDHKAVYLKILATEGTAPAS